jgi:hypothetical protein
VGDFIKMKVALVTPWLPHLPFHPSCFLGYGAAVLSGKYDLEVIDLNAEIYFRYRGKLERALDSLDKAPPASDVLLNPLFDAIVAHIDRHYGAISWQDYPVVYVTPPCWFPMVPAKAVLRLSRAIKRVSPNTKVFFFGNSLGSWTNEEELKKRGVRPLHLNDLFAMKGTAKPVNYDLLPNPIYEHREKYLFDLLPFTLKHGCSWGRCRFCSLSRGWNSGYLERSVKAVINELEKVIQQYDPAVLVCRDHTLNGRNLVGFCAHFKRFNKPWCGQSRADLSGRKIEALRRAGCRGLFFGLESGSDRVLRAINKGITSKQVSDFIKTLHSNGIFPAPSVIIGAPGEGEADFDETIRFLENHSQYFDFVNAYPFMPTPACDFGSQQHTLDKNVTLRLIKFIQICEDFGLKVILGEQSIEYFLFKRTCDGHLADL